MKKNHKWDFLHVKSLVGQGRLYVQLKAPSSEIIRRASISEYELDEPAFGSVLPISDINQDIRSWAVHTSREPAANSSGINEPAASSSGINEPASNINSQMATLRGIFPYAVESDLELAISREGSISGAVDLLLNNKNVSSELFPYEPSYCCLKVVFICCYYERGMACVAWSKLLLRTKDREEWYASHGHTCAQRMRTNC